MLRVLISAYACEPGKGSEPEVGFEIVRNAARAHEVWLVTRENNVDAVLAGLTGTEGTRVRVVGFDLGRRSLSTKRALGRAGVHPYYDRWQRGVGEMAVDLDRDIGFDVVHHATFAAYWMRIGVAAVPKPLVVGPVGGGVVTPLGMLPALGSRGLVGELARRVLRPVLASAYGARRVLSSAHQVLVQNPETAARAQLTASRVLPNGLVGTVEPRPTAQFQSTPPVVLGGRLIAWKGPILAVAAWRHLPAHGPELHIYGSGPERRRLERAIVRWGLEGRVRIMGAVPRATLLDRIATAGAVIHPALHDDSPLSVAEALSLGTPLVCLDLAGPPVISSYWPLVPQRAVPASTTGRTAAALAAAVLDVYGRRVPPDSSPRALFGDELLSAYRLAVAS